MLVALARFDLRIPGCGSLKEKRHVVKTLTNGIRSKFNVAVAEVDHHDLWQRTAIGVAAVAGEPYHARRVLHEVEKLVERLGGGRGDRIGRHAPLPGGRGMTEGARPSRVSEELREILAEEIPKLKDPRVGFVTVTGVRVTPDLRLARVFYTSMGDERARRATAAALRSARGHLRQVIGHEVRMKVLPDLRFEEDAAVDEGDRIEELLRELHRPEADGEDR